jgi:hypothetical protein
VRALTIAGMVLVLAGCAGRETPPPGRLVPVQRLVDTPPATLAAGVHWSTYASLAHEDRLAIAHGAIDIDVVRALPPEPDAQNGQRDERWVVPIPDRFRTVPWILVSPHVVSGGTFVSSAAPFVVSPSAVGYLLRLDPDEAASAPGAQLVAMLFGAPALEERDVVGPPLVLPRGAVAAVGMGIDESLWRSSCAVEFRIGVLEAGRETVLSRTVLDPAARPEHRGWIDARVELGAFAGRTVALRLSTAPADPSRPCTSFPIWADPTILAPRSTYLPNVVLLSLDTLRARSVSAYGSPRATTPHLDRLVGAAGTVFENAFTTAPHTLPAHLSAFTGLYVRALGWVGPLSHLSASIATLPERMRETGYDTAAFTEDGFVIPAVGFRRGFATYRENTSPDFHHPLGQSAKTYRDGLDWLAARRDRPSFLFLHTYEVHFPYTPAPPYDGAFESADEITDPVAIEQLRYEQEARYLDDVLRAFFDSLDGLGLGTQTLVVLMADHGEEFREHGALRHGLQVYDETIHVPLMMRLPGVIPAGLRVATPVSLVDVAPTILDLVGASPLVGADGESLLPLLAGDRLSERRQAVFSECASALNVAADLLSVRLPALHCIYRTRLGTSECYDPAEDPGEHRPVTSDHPLLETARTEAIAYWTVRRTGPASTAPLELVDELERGNEVERREKLRALGYVE